MSKRTGNRRGRPPIHGCFSLLHKLDKEVSSPEIRAYLTSVRAGIIEDKGGEENMSTAELVLVERVISKLGVLRLVELYCNRNGIMTGPALHPVLGDHYLAYANSLRLDLQALGLKRTGMPGPTLEQYIAANYPAGSPTNAQDDRSGAIVPEVDQEDGKKDVNG